MAGKIESLREYIGESDSVEIFPCKDCINKGVEIESDGFCTDCRIFLCKECIKSHKQGDRGSHIVINIESGCAYLGDYSRRQLGEIWVPDDSETIASATGDAYDFLELESTDNRDINYKDSDDSSTIDEWLSLDDEESFTQDFLEEKEPAEEKTSDTSELPFFSRLGRNSQKPNRIGFWSIEDSIHESEDDPQLDTDDEIRNFKFIADATIPIKVNSNVSSVAMLTEDTLVIVDNGINYVIVLQVLQDTVTIKGTIVFNDIPFGVARTCNNEFVVTFPDQHAVRFVDFEGNDFHVGHAREVHGACFGIGMLENNMVIAYPASGLIRILTKEGFVLKTIKTDPINLSIKNGQIAVYEKNIFILDRLQKYLCRCDPLSSDIQTNLIKSIAQCSDDHPVDFTISSDGDIYVAVPSSNRINRIHGNTMEIDCVFDSSDGVHVVDCLSYHHGVLAALGYKPSTAEIEIRLFEI